MALSSYGLVVAAASPYRSMADVIAAARSRPGQVTFGSPGPGSAQHLSGELLMRLANLTMQHILSPCSTYARTLGLGDWLGMNKLYGHRH